MDKAAATKITDEIMGYYQQCAWRSQNMREKK